MLRRPFDLIGLGPRLVLHQGLGQFRSVGHLQLRRVLEWGLRRELPLGGLFLVAEIGLGGGLLWGLCRRQS